MFKNRLAIIVSVILFPAVACFILVNWNAISDEFTRIKTSRSLAEAKQEWSDTITQIPRGSDELLFSELNEPYIPDAIPECITSRSYQIFTSDNDYESTRSLFIEQFEDMGWREIRNPGSTPYVLINFLSPNEHMRISIFPLSEFEESRINYPDFVLQEENIYAIEYSYRIPNMEICLFG